MQIITLKNGNFTAKINASRGANCISLRYKNAKILREPDYSEPLDNPYLYGMPMLFPQNRISGGAFEFEGRRYDFGVNEEKTNCYIHGILHSLPFEITEQSGDKAALIYRSNGEYPGYSEHFSVRITYRLSENGLNILTEITNLSNNNMPVFFGYHTTFNLPFNNSSVSDVLVKAEVEEEIERNMSVYLPTGNLPPFDSVSKALHSGEFISNQPISRHYKTKDGAEISLYDQKSGIIVRYESKGFPFRLVYNGNADGYICIEPISSAADSPNNLLGREYSGFDYIEPNNTTVYKSAIIVEEL